MYYYEYTVSRVQHSRACTMCLTVVNNIKRIPQIWTVIISRPLHNINVLPGNPFLLNECLSFVIGMSGVRILFVLLRRVSVWQEMLTLSGTPEFTPFLLFMILPIHYINILQNLSVYGLCLRIFLPELVWLLVSDLFCCQRLGAIQTVYGYVHLKYPL